MATIFKSSIGKKLIQSISGAFLIIFILLHATINFFSVIDSFTGKYGVVAADAELFSKGDGLFKLGCDFMSTPVIDIMVPVLALGFLVHILYGMWLSIGNYIARGGVKRYAVASKAKADSWSAKNMFVLGLLIILGIALHLTDFWARMQLPEMFGIGTFEENPYILLNHTFGRIPVLVLYIAFFVVLWFHLTHGFWSMFQTVGWNNMLWLKRLKVIGVIVATIVCLALVCVAVNACLQAHGIIGDFCTGCCCCK